MGRRALTVSAAACPQREEIAMSQRRGSRELQNVRGTRNDIVRNRSYQQYVQGNVALKEDHEEEPRRTGKRRQNSPQQRLLRSPMSAPYLLFLIGSAIVGVCMCVMYLNTQSQITETRNGIYTLRSSIETLSSQNDSIDFEINGYTDLEYIYRVATEELGMVQASEDQVSLYRQSEKEYMKQYNDIP